MAGKKANNYYFEAFARGIALANEAVGLLTECFGSYDIARVEERLDEMHRIEHTADGIRHEMMEKLMREFLPPIEREDIVELAHAIDDVTDAIEDVLRGLYMYDVDALREEVQAFGDVIVRCCATLAEAAAELANFRKSTLLREQLVRINELEEEGDRIYVQAMRRLYTGEQDAVRMLAWTTLYDRLERCCDACEEVAERIEQVIMKNS